MEDEKKSYTVYPELEKGEKKTGDGAPKKFLDNVCEDVSLIVKVEEVL